MSARPWHKRYHSDALTGYAMLSLELRGAYTTILDSLYDSDGARGIMDNPRRIAGLLDVSTRRWEKLRADLLEAGKIELVDGLITNRRYLRELDKQRRISEKRAQAGSKGGKAKGSKADGEPDAKTAQNEESVKANAKQEPSNPQASLETPSATTKPLENVAKTDEFGSFSRDSRASLDSEPAPITTENSRSGQANAEQMSSYTRATPEARGQSLLETTESPTTTSAEPGRVDDDEFPELDEPEPASVEPTSSDDPDEAPRMLVDRVALLGRKAGINLTVPAKLITATEQLKAWESEGFGFEAVVLPTIERLTRENPSEVIYSLRYFDGAIRKAAAIASDPKAKPVKVRPPAAPIAAQDGTDERVGQFRRRLDYHLEGKGRLYGPDRVAVVIRDGLLELTFRNEGEKRGAELDESFSHVRGIASAMGLTLRARALV